MKGFTLPKLGRDQSKRQSMIRQLVTHLFEHEHIKTTFARAKAIQRYAEHCISMAKRNSLFGKLKIFHFVNVPPQMLIQLL
jgi:large subunit ribosomal protein L17